MSEERDPVGDLQKKVAEVSQDLAVLKEHVAGEDKQVKTELQGLIKNLETKVTGMSDDIDEVKKNYVPLARFVLWEKIQIAAMTALIVGLIGGLYAVIQGGRGTP